MPKAPSTYNTVAHRLGTDIEAVPISEVEDRDMIFQSFRFFKTQYGDAMAVTVSFVLRDASTGEETVDPGTTTFITHSEVLLKQAQEIEADLPLRGTVTKKKGRYYTFA